MGRQSDGHGADEADEECADRLSWHSGVSRYLQIPEHPLDFMDYEAGNLVPLAHLFCSDFRNPDFRRVRAGLRCQPVYLFSVLTVAGR